MLRETDVLVAGGGPAGLVAAIAARRHGFRATVVEAARPPIDKACGEGLMPEGVAALRRLGVSLAPGGGAAFRGLRFLEPGLSAEAVFPHGCGVGMRRATLHTLLMQHAAAAGVSMSWGTRIDGLAPEGAFVGGHLVRSRWIIGADGQNSRCRVWAGLDRVRPRRRRFGFRRAFALEPWTDFVEVHWSERAQAYVTPVGPAEVSVVLLSRDQALRFDSLFTMFPALARRLRDAPATTPVRGAVTATFKLPSVVRSRIALIGEASGSVDALTGEGLTLVFRQAIALGEALAHGDLSLYQQAHRRAARLPAMTGNFLLLLDRYPWLRRRLLRAFASDPALFYRLLAIHTGAEPPAALGIGGTLSLGWELLTA